MWDTLIDTHQGVSDNRSILFFNDHGFSVPHLPIKAQQNMRSWLGRVRWRWAGYTYSITADLNPCSISSGWVYAVGVPPISLRTWTSRNGFIGQTDLEFYATRQKNNIINNHGGGNWVLSSMHMLYRSVFVSTIDGKCCFICANLKVDFQKNY